MCSTQTQQTAIQPPGGVVTTEIKQLGDPDEHSRVYRCGLAHPHVGARVDCISLSYVCKLAGTSMVPPGEDLFPSVFIAALLLLNTADSANPFAVTSVGVIQGTEESSPDGLLYFAFRGIRYARPPTGGLRWKPPVALPEWQGVYEATDFRPGCPQLTTKVTTSEDCLFLDVYVPHNVSGLYNDATKALEAWEKGDNATASPATGSWLLASVSQSLSFSRAVCVSVSLRPSHPPPLSHTHTHALARAHTHTHTHTHCFSKRQRD